MAGFSEMKNPSRIIIPTEPQAEATSPPTPHFDDEATLLTARAVVPIEEAAASANIRSYLVKAAIVLTAALLGAAVAVSVDFFQNRRPPTTAVVEPSAPASRGAVSETLDTSQLSPRQSNEVAVPALTSKASSTSDQSDPSATPDVKTKEKTPANHSARNKEKSAESNGGAVNPGNVVVKRSERRAQRRQAAKVERSEDADQIVGRPRDAGRIREIFEGPSPF